MCATNVCKSLWNENGLKINGREDKKKKKKKKKKKRRTKKKKNEENPTKKYLKHK